MKNIYFNIILFLGSLAFAQNNKLISSLVDAEIKSARNLKSFVANPNTDNYNITYHKLEFTVDPTVYFISGKVTTNFIANSNMSTLTFDMSTGLTATSVKINGVSTTFSQSGNNELVINLSSILAPGTAAISEVIYSGNPTTTGFGSFEVNTHNGTPVLWTLSEPYGARDWWPCKQDLNDKINAIDVYITAPSQYTAVSNGIEPDIPVITGAYKTTHFRHQYAIPAYLIAIAVTNYSVYNQSGGTFPNNYPIVNYVYPENLTSAQSDLAQTPLILNLYESLYEVYPFKNEKYGHAQFGWGGGMEHTTVSFMGGFGRGLIAHEMAHQWFGDKITCGTWKDIWLNESFATYLAAQVIENFDGIPAFISEKTEMINYITSVNEGNVYKTDSEILTVGGIFDYRTTYIKGAMVIEMLRFKMGDALFFQGIKNYLADANLAYKYAITTDLQSHLEAVFGSSLQEFFNDWVYGQGYPSYYITGQKISDTQTKFQVFQNTSSNPNVTYFEMPVPIRVLGAAGQVQNLILQNNSNGQIFIENIPFDVVSIIFDPNKHLISKENITDVLAPALVNENFDLNQNIVVAPNPANDFVNIVVPSFVKIKRISIYNTLGQKVLENTTGTVFVNDLSNGIYNLEVNTSEGMIHKKFIKN